MLYMIVNHLVMGVLLGSGNLGQALKNLLFIIVHPTNAYLPMGLIIKKIHQNHDLASFVVEQQDQR